MCQYIVVDQRLTIHINLLYDTAAVSLNESNLVTSLRLSMSAAVTNFLKIVPFFATADLGMFSMFGRTGAPTKRSPTKGAANFCMPEKWVTPE